MRQHPPTKVTPEINDDMAYRLKAGESVPEGIKRIVVEEIDAATEQLSHKQGDSAEAIHEARKSIKKIRGALRLVQQELDSVYQIENRRLQEIGHKLSEIRDAAAVIEVFDTVIDKYNEELQKNALASIRRGLQKSKREMEQAADLNGLVRRAVSALQATRKRVSRWPLKQDSFRVIASGLTSRYRRGRKAMAIAREDGTPENYHEWRKRVKDHWYHLRLLESLWTDVMRAHEDSLKNLQDWLGDDHNLVVLCTKIQADPGRYGTEKDIQLFTTLAGQHQNELRQNAISLGERVYKEKPRAFARSMSKLWDAWHEQPDSMKAIQKQERKAPKKQAAKSAADKQKQSAA